MKPTKEQIKQHYTQAVQRALDLFERLDERDWGKKPTRWTAKDCLAHLLVTLEGETMPLVRQALAGEPAHLPGFDQREAIDEFNEGQLATVRDLSTGELTGRLKAAAQHLVQVLDGLSEADLDRPASSPRWDRSGTVRDLFLASYLHLPVHYQDVRRVAKKKIPHWMEASAPEEVNFHLGRIFHYMPLIFWSSRGGDMSATYAFNLEGRGGGQWAVRIDDGRAETEDGMPEGFDVEVRTQPELWMDLSTNDLNPMWAITTRKVHLGGNAALALKLGSLFQVSG